MLPYAGPLLYQPARNAGTVLATTPATEAEGLTAGWRMMADTFRVGLTHDFLTATSTHDMRLDLLNDTPGIEWTYLPEATELSASDIAGHDALLVLGPRVTAASLEGADRLTVLARFGVGYD